MQKEMQKKIALPAKIMYNEYYVRSARCVSGPMIETAGRRSKNLTTTLDRIEEKVLSGERLSREDGIALFQMNDLARIGALADKVRQRITGDYVYFNVNRHVNLTNKCTALCKFCAFGCEEGSKNGYEMTKQQALDLAAYSAQDPDLRELHIVSACHPSWPFEYYVDIIKSFREKFPQLHRKAFTGVEVQHFAKISGKSIKEVLKILVDAGMQSMPGGGAEILTDRVRNALCPNKATADQWLEVAREAHKLGIKTNASMLYGHIETLEERVEHMLKLRDLQDETGGFQTFIPFPFQPGNTALEATITRTTVWDDLRTIAISRLMLDNFKYIKANWVMLPLPVAQLALGFGANDIAGTISEARIMHAAKVKSSKALSRDNLVDAIFQTGLVPVERDSWYNIVRIYEK